MAESVRLVVWDLDDTFWRGTVTEGGIQAYIQEHHDIVIELARRGIMSSVCSKNDKNIVLNILRDKGILDYIIFPSISWEIKGPRIAALIDIVQLRPATVMFIDDNANNRGEVAALIPGIQIEDETFISKMLCDPRFVGKNDAALTRLSQYKTLEKRKQDQQQNAGDNEAFLRTCDIRVCLEYNFEDLATLDRAIELINRTNQLNFTKKRLPENITDARIALRSELNAFHRQAGLVRVADKYGDYGFVGFFMTETDVFRPLNENGSAAGFRTLRHFCFSCRTLGMLIEKWVYDYLHRPHLDVVGEVLTDLRINRRVDWVTLVTSLSEASPRIDPVMNELRVFGGCETYSTTIYLAPHCNTMTVRGNFASDGVFFRINSSALAVSAIEHGKSDEFQEEAARLGAPIELLGGSFFDDAPLDTTFVFSGAFDIQGRAHYRHRKHKWELVYELNGLETVNLTTVTEDELQERLNSLTHLGEARLARLAEIARHTRTNYESTRITDDRRISTMRTLIELVPLGSRLIITLDHFRLRLPDGTVRGDPPTEHYNRLMQALATEYPYVATVCFSDVIEKDEQIQIGGNHYDRIVYLRMAELLVETAKKQPVRC